MGKVRGVNLQNWLVLEKWMGDSPLSRSNADDEHGMMQEYAPEEIDEMLEQHRSTYVTRDTFVWLAQNGCNVVRIPIPYHLFGSDHHRSCSKHLNNAFRWAEEVGIGILVELHTVPMGQNGADHGGYIGMCRWNQSKDRVDRTLAMLSRVVGRYAGSPAFWGIDPLNEPGSKYDFERLMRRYKNNPVYESRFLKSSYITTKFLMQYYEDFYAIARGIAGNELRVVLNDNFYLPKWNGFMNDMFHTNVWMDTHKYVSFQKRKLGAGTLEDHRRVVEMYAKQIEEANRYHPVIVGEWSLSNRCGKMESMDDDERRKWYRQYADMQIDAWDKSEGGFFTSLKVSWDGDWNFESCVRNGWIDLRHGTR